MEAISRVPVVQQAVEQLKGYLFSGELKAGEKLPAEKALCAQLSIGRGSLREALRVLASTGYLTLQPGRGAFVLRTDEIDVADDVISWFSLHEVEVQDYLEVRSVCEPLAARLAVERCTDEKCEKLRQIHERFTAAVESGDQQKIIVEEGNFHDSIIDMSENKLLINIFKLLRQQTISFRYRSLYLPNAPQDALTPHRKILRAFEIRDAEYAEACMREHVRLAIQNFKLSMLDSPEA